MVATSRVSFTCKAIELCRMSGPSVRALKSAVLDESVKLPPGDVDGGGTPPPPPPPPPPPQAASRHAKTAAITRRVFI
jgi:hypothetical protein